MQKTILIIVAVALVGGCASTGFDLKDPNQAKIEKAVRAELGIPEGELTQSDMDRVTHLNLDGMQLTDVRSLENLPQLKDLGLKMNPLTHLKNLEKLSQLERLHFDSNNITDYTVTKKLPKLIVLTLARTQLTDVKWLEDLKQLKELHLHGNPHLTKAQVDQLQKALPNCNVTYIPAR